MNKRFSAWMMIAFALMSLPQAAEATATTHIWAPSTDVQPFLKWHITGDMYLPVETDAAGQPYAAVTNAGLTVGVLPFKHVNMELGFDHKTGYGALDRYPLYLNAKLGIPEDALGKYVPALAVGVYDVGTRACQKATVTGTNADVLYAKLAKTVNPLGRFSVGYFSGNEDLLLNEKGEKDNSGLMAAWERALGEISDKLWFCLEYMGSESSYGTFNVGAAWKFADNVSVLAAYDIYNNRDLNLPDTFSLQVDIDFDFPEHAK
jgi:hypothetical protein